MVNGRCGGRRPARPPDGRRTRWPALLAVAVLAAGCTGDAPDPAPTIVAPSGTVRRLQVGTQVEVTAAVTRVFSGSAFLVADADLPAAGQVVVSAAPVPVRVTDLVTVSGRVELLDRAAFSRYGIADPQVYDTSAGIAVVAASVRGYPPASPRPSPPT